MDDSPLPADRSHTLAALPPGPLECQWRDRSGSGASPWSATAAVTVSDILPPGAPTLSAAITHDAGNVYDITLTSTAGTLGMQDVTRYDLACRGTGETVWITTRNNQPLPPNRAVTISTSLQAGDGYECRWRDRTADTASPWSSTASVTVTAPGRPTLIGSVTDPHTADFHSVAGTPGTVPVARYSLQCRADPQSAWQSIGANLPLPGSRAVRLLNLPTGHYECQWRDHSDSGDSPWSATAAVTVVDVRLPGRPTLTAAVVSDSAIRYTSTAGPAGDLPVQYFGLRCSVDGRPVLRRGSQRHATGGSRVPVPVA